MVTRLGILTGGGDCPGRNAAIRFPARVSTLGHVRRGGTPNAMDRQLATRMGVKAVDTARDGDWGTMTADKDLRVQPVPPADAFSR